MVLSLQTRQFYRAKERSAKRYSSDLTDQEWEVIRPLLPTRSQGRGHRQELDEREILNGIFYQLHKKLSLLLRCKYQKITQRGSTMNILQALFTRMGNFATRNKRKIT